MGIVDFVKDNLIKNEPQADEKTIRIECDGSTTVDIDELHELQGSLKDLSDANYLKGKTSILENGFSFPVLMWVDQAGTKWIIDFHQRKRILKRMRDTEGYNIPKLMPYRILCNGT